MSASPVSTTLKACPSCGKKEGRVVERLGARFPYYAACRACGWATESVKLQAIAEKLWNEAKKPR